MNFSWEWKKALSWPQVIKRKQDLPLVSDDDLIYYQNNSNDFRNKLGGIREFGYLKDDTHWHAATLGHWPFLILDTIGMRCLTDARKITSVYIFQMIKKTKTYSVLYCFSILLVKLYNMQVHSVRYLYLTYELHEQKVIIQKLN